METVKPVVTRLGVAILTIAVVGAGVVLGAERPAAACTCAGLTDPEALARADAAFIGRVTEFEGPELEQVRSSLDPVTWTFTVERVFKGGVRATQEVVSVVGSEACGLALDQHQRYLVFANAGRVGKTPEPSPGPGQLAANMCMGTRTATANESPETFPPGTSPSVGVASPQRGADAESSTDSSSWPWIVLAAVGGVVVFGGITAFAVRRTARST